MYWYVARMTARTIRQGLSPLTWGINSDTAPLQAQANQTEDATHRVMFG